MNKKPNSERVNDVEESAELSKAKEEEFPI